MRGIKLLSRATMALAMFGLVNVSVADTNKAQTKNETGVHVELRLSDIVSNIASEKSGDELYITVTDYSNFAKPGYSRIPSFPTYWLAKHLNSVSDIKLWEHNFNNGEASQIIISLIEHDMPPWNVDDLIGSVKVNIANRDGKLDIKWDPSIYNNEAAVEQPIKVSPNFVMKGQNSNYNVTFKIDS